MPVEMLKKLLKQIAQTFLLPFDLELRRVDRAAESSPAELVVRALQEWRQGAVGSPLDRFVGTVLQFQHASAAQLFQDLLIVHLTAERRGGFFVEFGATDGLALSNTYMLESVFGWRGILAEPARGWSAALRTNRPNANIDTRCVWTKTGERLLFNETEFRELSSLQQFSAIDGHADKRRGGERYEIETVSLTDLLAEHQAPKLIDYLSIDTEGSEFDILSAHDWSAYRFRLITVEHNCTSAREKIRDLLEGHGYLRVFESLSRWDDWYVLSGTEEARRAGVD